MTDGQREILESLARSRTAPHREVTRAKALLLAARGLGEHGDRGTARGVAGQRGGVAGAVRRGGAGEARPGARGPRAQALDPGRRRSTAIVQRRCTTSRRARRTGAAGRWPRRRASARPRCSGSGRPGGSSRTGWRRSSSPTTSGSRRSSIDVVGLYLNPPDKAVVLCMDEKSQIQALDRTQPTLPMKPGPGRHHDPRLQAQRHHHPVRRAERAHRHGDRPVPAQAQEHRVPALPAPHRPRGPQGPGRST